MIPKTEGHAPSGGEGVGVGHQVRHSQRKRGQTGQVQQYVWQMKLGQCEWRTKMIQSSHAGKPDAHQCGVHHLVGTYGVPSSGIMQ